MIPLGSHELLSSTTSTTQATPTSFKAKAREAFNSAAETVGRAFPTAGGIEIRSQQLKLGASIAAWGGISILTAGAFPVGWLIGIGIGTALNKAFGSKAVNTSEVCREIATKEEKIKLFNEEIKRNKKSGGTYEKLNEPIALKVKTLQEEIKGLKKLVSKDKLLISLSKNINNQLGELNALQESKKSTDVRDKIKIFEALNREIEDNPNSIVTKLSKLSEDVDKELKELETNQDPNMNEADRKEAIDRLKLLRDEIKNNPMSILVKMQKFESHELYIHLQPVKFLSILAQCDKGTIEAGKNPNHLQQERVALFCFTENINRDLNNLLEDKPVESSAKNDQLSRILSSILIVDQKDIDEGVGLKLIVDQDIKEAVVRLKLLKDEIKGDPTYILKKMNEFHNDPLYRGMEPANFMSMLVKSDKNMSDHGDPINPHELSDLERVALYRYTTGDYRKINYEARKAKLDGNEIEEPGLLAYYKYTVDALRKLPDAPSKDKDGKPVELKRVYSQPTTKSDLEKFNLFVSNTFGEGKIFNDGSFLSTLIPRGMELRGYVNVTIKFPDMDKIPNGKSLGPPYSAFPNEGEILFIPGTAFHITNVEEKINVTVDKKKEITSVFVEFTPVSNQAVSA